MHLPGSWFLSAHLYASHCFLASRSSDSLRQAACPVWLQGWHLGPWGRLECRGSAHRNQALSLLTVQVVLPGCGPCLSGTHFCILSSAGFKNRK